MTFIGHLNLSGDRRVSVAWGMSESCQYSRQDEEAATGKSSNQTGKAEFPSFLIDIQYGRCCSSDLQEEKGMDTLQIQSIHIHRLLGWMDGWMDRINHYQ